MPEHLGISLLFFCMGGGVLIFGLSQKKQEILFFEVKRIGAMVGGVIFIIFGIWILFR
jgi:hypothetical protein